MRHWAGILFVVVVLLVATVAWRARPAPRPQTIASATALHNDAVAEPDVQMIDMHLMAQLSGTATLQVVAKRAILSGSERQAIVHGIQARMQQASGRAWYLSAARGFVDRVTGDMTVQGGVHLYEKDGYILETENLSLRAEQQVLRTDTAVRLRGNTILITGTGLQHEIDKNRITIQHQVKASFRYGRTHRRGKGHLPLEAFNVDRRPHPFGHGTTRAGADAADAVSGN